MLTLGFWGHCFHMQRILFFGRGSSRIMTFGFLAYDPDLFFAKEGRCKTQAFQNAQPSIAEAYSIYSSAHEKHMRHSCVPRCSHARSDAKSVAHSSNWTRGSNYIGYNFRDGCVLMCNEDSMQFEYATCLQFFFVCIGSGRSFD